MVDVGQPNAITRPRYKKKEVDEFLEGEWVSGEELAEGLKLKADKATVFTKEEHIKLGVANMTVIDTKLAAKADKATVYTKEETDKKIGGMYC